jgi:hypothetical protein
MVNWGFAVSTEPETLNNTGAKTCLVFCVSVQKGLEYKQLRVAVDASIRYRRRFLAEVYGGGSQRCSYIYACVCRHFTAVRAYGQTVRGEPWSWRKLCPPSSNLSAIAALMPPVLSMVPSMPLNMESLGPAQLWSMTDLLRPPGHVKIA